MPSNALKWLPEKSGGKIIDLNNLLNERQRTEEIRELLAALNDGNFSAVSMLSAYFEEGFDFAAVEGFEKAAKEFVRQVLLNDSLTPHVARFFIEEMGQGIRCDAEIREAYSYWLEGALRKEENADFHLAELEDQFGEEVILSDLYADYLGKKVKQDLENVLAEAREKFQDKITLEQFRKLTTDIIQGLK